MKKIPRFLYKAYLTFFNSIAFYPLAISLVLFILAMLMSVYETAYKVDWIEEYSFLWIKGHDNARSILTTIVAGTISFMVFSFSMVMIVLNQASSNLSPRVIPGLITQRPHQVVLGFYLGTIIYGLILLHNIKPEASDYDLPQLGIFLGEFLGIVCISLFVYFIHSISKSIQIDTIIYKIFNDTLLKLEENNRQEELNKDLQVPDTGEWKTFNSIESGYYRNFNEDGITGFAAKNNLVIYVQVPIGSFIVKNSPFLKISRQIDENELRNAVAKCFIFHQDEYIRENSIYGFKQLSEIAVKALSPGINDPGSAIRVIEYMVLLFVKQMGRNSEDFFYDEENKLRIVQRKWTLDQMLYYFIGPIRECGKNYILVNLKLLEALKYLLYADKEKKFTNIIKHNLTMIAEDAERSTKNSGDLEMLKKYIKGINNLGESSDSVNPGFSIQHN